MSRSRMCCAKRMCMFKREKLGQGESKLFFAARQRQKRADYILVTPFFVPFTLRIVGEVLLDQHASYHAAVIKQDRFMPVAPCAAFIALWHTYIRHVCTYRDKDGQRVTWNTATVKIQCHAEHVGIQLLSSFGLVFSSVPIWTRLQLQLQSQNVQTYLNLRIWAFLISTVLKCSSCLRSLFGSIHRFSTALENPHRALTPLSGPLSSSDSQFDKFMDKKTELKLKLV